MFHNPIFFVAHPGHELRVWGWIAASKSPLNVLTDGAGRNGAPRIESTRRLLGDIGACPGPIFGELSDADFYRAILERRHEIFRALLHRLVDDMIAKTSDAIIGDAYEGFNPAHDVCRTMIDAAAAMVAARTGRPIGNYDFPVTEFEHPTGAERDGASLRLALDDDQLEKKLHCARTFDGLKGEIGQAIATLGADYFRTEWLRDASGAPCRSMVGAPYYETVAKERVATGAYDTPIEYARHVAPLLRALRDEGGLS